MSRRGKAALTALLLALSLACAREALASASADSAAARAGGLLTDVLHLSTSGAEKLARIGVIVLIGLVAKLCMDLVQLVSRFLVFSTWGPLKHLFRNHQRSITLHALGISLVRYVVYFTALGYVLNELGVNYKAYLASLSVIGLAIGFGSQGLVQDVVTGFFILFENQFSVGDMVELSGQVGIVEDIGLRTTRLRNYLGAQIVFQNRNIPMAIRYKKGAYEVAVDVATAAGDTADRAAGLLEKIGGELHRQFQEIIMEKPTVSGLMELETGERFVRLQTKIWPQQQWVVDTQLLPRIREIFKREGLEIPGDRVVAFYHLPGVDEEQELVLERIGRLVRKATDRADTHDE